MLQNKFIRNQDLCHSLRFVGNVCPSVSDSNQGKFIMLHYLLWHPFSGTPQLPTIQYQYGHVVLLVKHIYVGNRGQLPAFPGSQGI